MLRKCLSPTERFDALIKICISGFIAAHHPTDPRQHARKINIVKRAHKTIGRIGKLQNRYLSAGLKDAVHLTQTLVKVLEIATSESTCNSIKSIIFKGHRLRIGMNKLHLQPSLRAFSSPYLHHLIRQINAGYTFCFPTTQNLYRQISCSDCHIQNMPGRLHKANRFPTP